MNHLLSIVCFVLALLVLPACYISLCKRMSAAGVPRPPYFGYFALFRTVGGWLLAFALSPSGLAASCIVFLMTIAPLSLLVSGFRLWRLPERTLYHRAAIYGSFGYIGLLGLIIATIGVMATALGA